MRLKFLSRRANRTIISILRRLNVDKRQRFVVGVIFLSLTLFVSEFFLGKSGVFMVFLLSFLADLFLFFALYEDLRENFYPQIFILPFLYSLAFGLFYLLIPARLLTRIVMASFYGVGLYSLFLSINIFSVSSVRTIALLSSARTVSLAIILLSYFFLANVVFSLHTNILFTDFLIILFTFPLVLGSIWVYTLERSFKANIIWTGSLTALILETSTILWFWPSTPTLIALFLTGVFYALIGLSQAWFEKRLFRGVIFEYFWVAVVTFIVLLFFTIW